MKKFIPGLKTLVPFGLLVAMAGIFCYSVNADSIITIPVPNPNPDRKVTMSLRIPAQTEPLTRQEQLKPAIAHNRTYVWDSNPSPKISNDDEIHVIFANLCKKGWVKSRNDRAKLRSKPLDKYYAVRIIENICNSIIEIGQARNFNNAIKRVNLTASDVEDVRRLVKRFEKELVLFGNNPNKMDKDLLIIQERLKKNSEGILRVIRVEGADDGATIIHMTVD